MSSPRFSGRIVMPTMWVVEYCEDIYGPFLTAQEASDWCDYIQARSAIKIRPVVAPNTVGVAPSPEGHSTSHSEKT